MPIISERDRETITRILAERMVDPVQIIYFTMPTPLLYVPGRPTCPTCADVQRLLEEIASTSDKISLSVHNIETEREEAERYGVERVPAIILTGRARGAVRYFGAPTGTEFPVFIDDLQRVSTGETALAPETREALSAITDPIHLQVFVTPT